MSVKEEKYIVVVKHEKGKRNSDGKLSGEVKNTVDNKVFKFDPLTSLCDLLDPSVFDESKGRLPKTHIDHPFFTGREYEGEDVFMKEYRFSTMLYALSSLKSIITEKKRFLFSELEIAKQVFDLTFSCKIEFEERNILYDWGYTINPINGEKVHEFHYLPIEYTFDFDWDKLFEEYEDNAHLFSYTCYNVQDIIFSVLHYLILQKYKFIQCGHCGKYFAAKSEKTIYCKRKSPYKGYGRFSGFENLECEQAVRNIRQEIRRDKKRIDDYICALDRQNNTTKSFDFANKCENYEKKMQKHFTTDNLKEFEEFLAVYREQEDIPEGRITKKHLDFAVESSN